MTPLPRAVSYLTPVISGDRELTTSWKWCIDGASSVKLQSIDICDAGRDVRQDGGLTCKSEEAVRLMTGNREALRFSAISSRSRERHES